MNTVYVLISLIYSGHFVSTVVPTMEFKTQEKCMAAIATFENETQGKQGRATMRCVKIEK